MGALILRQQAIEPLGECRTLFDMCAAIARRMGVEQEFTEGRSHDEWVEYMYRQCRKIRPDLPESFEEAFHTGLFKWSRGDQPKIGLQAFHEDPDRSPLSTPSGKIEIFSRRLWDLARSWELPEGDVISALPEYHQTWGMPEQAGIGDTPALPICPAGMSRQSILAAGTFLRRPLGERSVPDQSLLQLIGHHHKQRTHSSYGNNPWLKEVAPHSLWINPLDAESRGITHGDRVRVFNEIGQTEVPAKVTPRIMPGVLSLPQGAWYTPDEKGLDKNGSINVLTSQRPSPLAKGNPQHTNLVQVEKVRE
jgi:anaerobic selenocysteine-containing dehydrogenase